MMSKFRDLQFELRRDILSAKTVPALSAGITSGLGLLVAQVAFGSFIFSGALAPYSSQGIGLILFGNFAACLLIALIGGYRGAIAGLSPALVIIMATITTTTNAQGDALFVTAATALIISALFTGVCCLMIGQFKLANLMRFIPYPVAAGFVSGIGATVCLAAMSMMVNGSERQAQLIFLDPAVLWTWLPGAAYGIALYLAMKRWGNVLILPVSVVATIVAYHLALDILGISGDEARALGLLLTSTADGNLWPALLPADLAHVEWTAVAGQGLHMLSLILIAFICVVMNIAGLELAVNQELDWNREFKATGFASVVAGVGGGTVATLVVPASMRSKLFGATTRLTGMVASIVIGVALLIGDGMLEFIPTVLVGGILVFAGLGMLDEGLVRSHKRLPRAEFGIILVIFIVIIFFGLLEGLGVGMLATLVFFAVRLSRVDSIESRFTVRERRSHKARPIPDRAILLEEGWRVQAYRLRGYIFFGSAGPLTEHLRKTLKGPSLPICLMLDFTAVSGLDFSAMNALSRFIQTANEAGVKIVLNAVSQQFKLGLERNLPASVFAKLTLETNEDRALEQCEEFVINAWRTNVTASDNRRAALLDNVADDLEHYLERQIQFEDLMDELRDWLTPREYSADDTIARADISQEGLQLLVSGRASIYDDSGACLYQFSPGDVIWFAATSDAQTTLVVADEVCRTMLLSPDAQRLLEEIEEQLIIKLYRYLLTNVFKPGESQKGANLSE